MELPSRIGILWLTLCDIIQNITYNTHIVPMHLLYVGPKQLTNRFQTQPHTKLWCNEANIKSQKIGVNLNKRPRMRALASALSLAIRCSQCKISNQSHPEPPTRICMLSSRPWRQRSIRQVRRKSKSCDCKPNHQWTFLYCLRSKTCKLWLRLEVFLSKVRQDAVKRRRFCLHR